MNRDFLVSGVIAALISAAVAGGIVHHFEKAHFYESGAATAASAPKAPQAVATAVPGLATATDFSGIVERYGPAVVNISVVGKAQQSPAFGFGNLDPNDPFSEFFKRFGPQLPQMPRGGPVMHGEGSGFIVSADGLILTNAHVVENAQEVTVKLTDRREFPAKVLGKDKQTDIAVIRIEAKDLPVVRLGDPSASRVGEPVLAIGSPFGFENSATAGIISAKSRALPEDTYVPFIQTDVAVNPGNSGGPLFNMRGEVIGINSQIYSRSGGYQGLSFAIPIDVAAHIEDQLVHHGKVEHGRLGVTIQDVTQALADSFGLKKVGGALVSSVEKGSPADDAGIETGDVIVSLDDHQIDTSSDVPTLIGQMKPGTKIKLGIVRKGSPKTVEVKVGAMKESTLAQNDESDAGQGRLGLAVRPLTPEEQRQAGTKGGLLVEDVSGPAASAGIESGDIVLSANGTSVSSGEQLRDLVKRAGRHVALLVQRGTAKIFMPIDLGSQ